MCEGVNQRFKFVANFFKSIGGMTKDNKQRNFKRPISYGNLYLYMYMTQAGYMVLIMLSYNVLFPNGSLSLLK